MFVYSRYNELALQNLIHTERRLRSACANLYRDFLNNFRPGSLLAEDPITLYVFNPLSRDCPCDCCRYVCDCFRKFYRRKPEIGRAHV